MCKDSGIMIIEMYGLPGAGKTTIIKELTGGNATSVSSEKGIKSFIIALAKKGAVYMPSSMQCKRKMNLILKNYNEPKYIRRTKEYQYNSIALIFFGYRNIRNDIYMDEGLIHRIVTMAVNYGVSDNDFLALLKIFESMINNARCFYLKISTESAFQAIRQRNRHKCEMDEFNDDQLMNYLKSYEHYFQVVHSYYGHNIVTRDNYEIMRCKI